MLAVLEESINLDENRRVLVVGSSNVGKTSMINALNNLNLKVNNDARGCTLRTNMVPPTRHGSYSYTFFDTAGLNETDQGTVTSEQAIRNLTELFQKVREGFNLIIFVMRIGTILRTDQTNYDLFVKVLTQNKIPTIGVITGCENEESMTDYANKNRQHYHNNGMIFQKIEATCFAKGGRLEKVYETARSDSAQRVWKTIECCASTKPIICLSEENIGIVIRRTWNIFCEWIRKPTWRTIVNRDLYDILGRMGFQDEAQKRHIANSVLNMV